MRLQRHFPNIDFWDGVTYDQIALMIEVVNEDYAIAYQRARLTMADLKDADPEEILRSVMPNWNLGDGMTIAEPLDAAADVCRGIFEAVERGLIVDSGKEDGITTPAVWRLQIGPVWDNLLATIGKMPKRKS